jgi:hypothetical protein
MTAKKNRPPSLKRQLEMAMAGNKALQEQLEALQKDQCNAMAPKEEERPYATRGGPNRVDAIYPPGCGPMELVWASGTYGSCVLGWQCDSFRVFDSRQKAADWLRAQARRIEEWDAAIGKN